MMMRYWNKLTGLVALLGLILSPPAIASKVYVAPIERYINAEVVFAGTYIGTRGAPVKWPIYQFHVTHVWKGSVVDTIDVVGSRDFPVHMYTNWYKDWMIYGYEWFGMAGAASFTPLEAAFWERYCLPKPVYSRPGHSLAPLGFEELVEFMDSDDELLRNKAGTALLYEEDRREEVLAIFSDIVREQRPGNPIALVSSMRYMGPEATPVLAWAVEHGSNSRIKTEAFRSLISITPPGDLYPVVMTALADTSRWVQQSAVSVLYPSMINELSGDEWEELSATLRVLSKQSPENVRRTLVQKLRYLDLPSGFAMDLLEDLRDQDPDVGIRAAARRAIDVRNQRAEQERPN